MWAGGIERWYRRGVDCTYICRNYTNTYNRNSLARAKKDTIDVRYILLSTLLTVCIWIYWRFAPQCTHRDTTHTTHTFYLNDCNHAKKRSSVTQHAQLTWFAVRNAHILRAPHTVGIFNQGRRRQQLASFDTVSTQARTPTKYWCTSWYLYSGTLVIGSSG